MISILVSSKSAIFIIRIIILERSNIVSPKARAFFAASIPTKEQTCPALKPSAYVAHTLYWFGGGYPLAPETLTVSFAISSITTFEKSQITSGKIYA